MFSGTTATEKPITLNTPIDTYIAHYSGRDKARRYRVGWWRSRLGDRAVTSITDDDIFRTLETYANAPARVYAGRDARREPIFRAKRGTPSGGSINRHHAALSAVIKWGIQRRLLPKGYTNPARLIERRKESLGRVRFLTDQQRKRLVEAARSSTWGSPEVYQPREYARLAACINKHDILWISHCWNRAMATTPHSSARSRLRQGIIFRFRDSDTRFGVSRRTAARLAKQLGMTETEVIHYAIAQLAREQLPAYEPDDTQLTPRQLKRIKQLEPQGRMRTTERLF